MKLKTLEQFESKDPCECGGNCGCGKSVNEKFSFSKKEVEAAASLIASAISKADKVKAEVHDLEYDKGRGAGFDISIDGEEFEGGSYVVKDNGDVVNAAIGNSHPNAVYNTIGNKDIADVFTNMKKYESVVTEATVVMDAIDPKSKTLKKLLKKYNVKLKVLTMNGPGGGWPEVEMTGSREDLQSILADPNGWDDPELGEYIEESDNTFKTVATLEAKKYKFKDLSKAWEFVYGEDMEDEYEGFYQEVVGKYKNKVTKADVANIWQKVYGEDITTDYESFFNDLKENLNQVAKLELLEANADGTISDDEDERRAELLERVKEQMQQLLASAEFDAKDIGGSFRSPGIMAEIKKELNNQLKKFR